MIVDALLAVSGSITGNTVTGQNVFATNANVTSANTVDLLQARDIDPTTVAPSEFDPPHSRGGGLFPISGGMLQVAGIQEDLVSGHVMVGEGPAEPQEIVLPTEIIVRESSAPPPAH